MDRPGERGARVGDGVDHLVAERGDVAGAQLAPAGRLDATTRTAEERVVLLPPVEGDGRPHQVVVRPDAHARCPDHLEHGEVVGQVQRHDLRPRCRQRGGHGGRSAHGALEDLLHGQAWLVLADGHLALLDEPVDVEHRFLL